jgi:hypothetical protein
MADEFDQAPGAARRAEPDAAFKHNAVPDDVEGHSIRRDEGIARRDEGEGFAKRQPVPDDGDDVEGHSFMRADDGAARRDDSDGFARKGPGDNPHGD